MPTFFSISSSNSEYDWRFLSMSNFWIFWLNFVNEVLSGESHTPRVSTISAISNNNVRHKFFMLDLITIFLPFVWSFLWDSLGLESWTTAGGDVEGGVTIFEELRRDGLGGTVGLGGLDKELCDLKRKHILHIQIATNRYDNNQLFPSQRQL